MPGMSVSADLAAAPPAAAPRTRLPSPYLLPLHTLRLLGRCALPLTLWFAAGEAVRFGLLYAAVVLSHGDWYQARLVGVMFLFTLVVLTALVTAVGMLHSLRGALWEISARRAAGEGNESFLAAFNRTALVFAGIYVAWGFLAQDQRDFLLLDFYRRPDGLFVDAVQGVDSTLGRGLIGLSFTISLTVMLGALVLRLIFAELYVRKGGRFTGIAAAFFELLFVLYGVVAVFTLQEERADWVAHRAVVAGTKSWAEQVMADLPALAAAWEWLGELWPIAVEAVIVPLVWLTVALLVYGAYVADSESFARGTRYEKAVRMERAHGLTRRTMMRLTAGLQERWIPLLHGLRLTAKGGAPLFGLFALCFVGVQILGEYLFRAGRYLAGAEEPYRWMVTDPPLNVLVKYVVTVLTSCLIAAAFDLATTRDRMTRPPQE